MEIFSALLAICAGNSPVTGEPPSQSPVTRNIDVFFILRLNKRLSKQSWGWWFETPSRPFWRHSNGSMWHLNFLLMNVALVIVARFWEKLAVRLFWSISYQCFYEYVVNNYHSVFLKNIQGNFCGQWKYWLIHVNICLRDEVNDNKWGESNAAMPNSQIFGSWKCRL